MRKNKWKKAAAAFIAITLLPLAGTAPTVEAGWLGDIVSGKKIKLPDLKKSMERAEQQARVYRGTMELNGEYYSGNITKVRNGKTPWAERTFTLAEPAFAKFHMLNYGKGEIHHELYDADGNCRFEITTHDGNPADEVILLDSGTYKIKTRMFEMASQDSVDYRLKGEAEYFPLNVPFGVNRPYKAVEIKPGARMTGFFETGKNDADDAQYFFLRLNTPQTLNFRMYRLADLGGVVFFLLDAEERQVEKLANYGDAMKEFTRELPAGTYYLKVTRSEWRGGVYTLAVE